MAHSRICLECGSRYQAKRAPGVFCCTAHRRNFNNRRQARGAELYDLFMACRFEREAAEQAGAWNFMCRMAADYKASDDASRAGRRSWDTIAAVKSRNAQLEATVISSNAAGARSFAMTVK